MAARAVAKIDINLGLVNIAVAVYPATESAATISFNQLHGECKSRIQQKKWCPSCEREVAHNELVKGYAISKDKYITVTEEELDKIQPETSRTLIIDHVVGAGDIDPVFFDRAYYLTAQSAAAAQSYAVIRDSLAGKMAIGKWMAYGREYLVGIRARDNGLVMHILHDGAEIRKQNEIAGYAFTEGVKVDKRMVTVAKQVLDTYESEFDPQLYEDEYKAAVNALIQSKVDGTEMQVKEDRKTPATLDFMAALEASLAAGKPAKKAKPAKVEAVTPKREKARKTA